MALSYRISATKNLTFSISFRGCSRIGLIWISDIKTDPGLIYSDTALNSQWPQHREYAHDQDGRDLVGKPQNLDIAVKGSTSSVLSLVYKGDSCNYN